MNTPETDAELERHVRFSGFKVCSGDFARNLEQDRNRLRDECAELHAAHNAKVFECQQLRDVCDELCKLLKQWSQAAIKTVEGCPEENCSHCEDIMPLYNSDNYCTDKIREAMKAYNSLPHVKEKTSTTTRP